jgi:STE24 endopeptidase
LIILLAAALQLAALPLGTALSRRWEWVADRFALDLTGDAGVFEEAFRTLALANLSDLAPPRALYYALFSHPTIPERIAFGRGWAEADSRVLTSAASSR